jgi:hypothetical protein
MTSLKNLSEKEIIHKLELIKTSLNGIFKEVVPPANTSFTSVGGEGVSSYMVRILLFGLIGLKNYGPSDKSIWHTYVKYKNSTFMIRESRFFSWTIEGMTNSTHTSQCAKEIHKYIARSCKNLDPILYTFLKKEVQKNNYYLNNTFRTLFSTYSFFKETVSNTLKEYDREQDSGLFIKDRRSSFGRVLEQEFRLNFSLSNHSCTDECLLLARRFSYVSILSIRTTKFDIQ